MYVPVLYVHTDKEQEVSTTMTLQLMRGPLLMAAVTVVLTLPSLLQLSIETLVCMGLFVLGIVITLWDVVTFAELYVRQRTSNFLENLVLEDMLHSIFDPETGWITCLISLFVGNASMYALPMSSEQRVRLIQSCLGTSEEQARSILSSPGGFMVMLPEALQVWLNNDDSKLCDETPNVKEIDTDIGEHECDRSNQTEETLESCEEEIKAPNAMEGEYSHNVGKLTSRVASSYDAPVSRKRGLQSKKNAMDASMMPAFCESPETRPPSPLDVMGSILRDLASDAIKHTCIGIPDYAIQTLAVAASAAFALHISCCPRARRIVAGIAEGTAALSFASVAVGAVAALITKAYVVGSHPGDGVERRQLLSSVRGILVKLRQTCVAGGGFRRLQGIIAVLILLHVGRRRTGRLPPSRHVLR